MSSLFIGIVVLMRQNYVFIALVIPFIFLFERNSKRIINFCLSSFSGLSILGLVFATYYLFSPEALNALFNTLLFAPFDSVQGNPIWSIEEFLRTTIFQGHFAFFALSLLGFLFFLKEKNFVDVKLLVCVAIISAMLSLLKNSSLKYFMPLMPFISLYFVYCVSNISKKSINQNLLIFVLLIPISLSFIESGVKAFKNPGYQKNLANELKYLIKEEDIFIQDNMTHAVLIYLDKRLLTSVAHPTNLYRREEWLKYAPNTEDTQEAELNRILNLKPGYILYSDHHQISQGFKNRLSSEYKEIDSYTMNGIIFTWSPEHPNIQEKSLPKLFRRLDVN